MCAFQSFSRSHGSTEGRNCNAALPTGVGCGTGPEGNRTVHILQASHPLKKRGMVEWNQEIALDFFLIPLQKDI